MSDELRAADALADAADKVTLRNGMLVGIDNLTEAAERYRAARDAAPAAASEQDEHRDWVPGVGRHDPMSQPPDDWLRW